MRKITTALTSVGFSTPPAWVKPYAVLSNGQQFRCDLARALLSEKPVIVYDEFSSVVDRTVAKIGSAAVSKAIRKDERKRKFVAVTCHYDVVDWLEPDWVLDMASMRLARRRLRRPKIELEIFKSPRRVWELFKKTHYLNAGLTMACALFVAIYEGQPCALVAMATNFGKVKADRPLRRVSRLVVLPDFQGVGIGTATLNAVAQQYLDDGFRVRITTGHPSMITLLKHSRSWRIDSVKKLGHPPRPINKKRAKARGYHAEGDWRGSTGRPVISAEFLPAKPNPKESRAALS